MVAKGHSTGHELNSEVIRLIGGRLLALVLLKTSSRS